MENLLSEIQKLKRENRKLKRQLEAIQKIIFGKKEVKTSSTVPEIFTNDSNEPEIKNTVNP